MRNLALAVFMSMGLLPAMAQTSLPGVVVQGRAEAALPSRPVSALASVLGDDWLTQPVSATVIGERLLRESGSQRLSDALRFDASVDSNYSPLGYAENFQIRGFPVDPVFGVRVNGVPVVGEAPLTLDNKRAIEVVRGPAGAWAGSATSAGLINLLTKRPETIGELGLRFSQATGPGTTLDWGQQDLVGGWRLNASLDRLQPYARGADGQARFVSLALDRALASGARLEVDAEFSRRSQITQPGSQLLGGSALPPINPRTVLGLSDWSRPTVFDSSFAMGRLEQRLEGPWRLTATASVHQVKTEDRSSFPWGCSGAGGTAAATYFCADGAFSLWDYRSLDEKRQTSFLEVRAAREARWFGLQHDLGLGLAWTERQTRLPNYVWDPTDLDYVDRGNAISRTWSGGPSATSAGVSVLNSRIRQLSAIASERVALGDWALAAQARWVEQEDRYEAAFPYYNVIPETRSARFRVLPSLALQRRWAPPLLTYLSYREDLAAGERAPLGSANNGELLPARLMQSIETGLRLTLQERSALSMAAFYGRRPLNFRDDPALDQAAGNFIQRGTESREGLELGATAELSPGLEGQLSATWMQSSTAGTENARFEGRQALNTPKFRGSAFFSYRVPNGNGLRLNAAWLWTGRRPAARDNTVFAPGYQRLDLGASLTRAAWTLRFGVDNVLDRRYWIDAAEYLGDGYLTPGAPRVVRASATLAF